jgi:hypothetical protein
MNLCLSGLQLTYHASKSLQWQLKPSFVMPARNILASIALASLQLPCLSHAFSYPDCINGPLADNLVCNSQAPEADRAAALVSAFNITEKLSLLIK